METRYDRTQRSLVLAGVKLTGVHSCIHELFFPSYDEKFAREGPTDIEAGKWVAAPAPMAQPKKLTKPKKPKSTKGRNNPFFNMLKGMKLGKKIDQELKYLSNLKPRNRPSRMPLMHDRTRKILAALNYLNLSLDKAQVYVGSLYHRLGTAVDLVCEDLDPEAKLPVIVEIKSGYNTGYFKHTRYPMLAPFGDQNDSLHNQHQLQLAATVALYCMSYLPPKHYAEHLKNIKAYVIRAHDNCTDVYELQDWARSRILQMMDRIANDKDRGKRLPVNASLQLQVHKVNRKRERQIDEATKEHNKKVKQLERQVQKRAASVRRKSKNPKGAKRQKM